MRKTFIISNVILCIGIAHIFYFIGQVQHYTALTENLATPQVDGIVVVTGAPYRIEKAVELLKEKRAQRLLVSGVHPSAKRSTILQNNKHLCCIDLDEKAANTRANVLESDKWIKAHNFHSIILVTSDYHMPRSLLEFHRVMPNLQIYPYSVVDTSTPLRFHVLEYAKYALACLRILLPTSI